MIIYSTTLDTQAKVIAIYGGTTWTEIQGRFILGHSSSYDVKSTGGSDTHTHTTSAHKLTTTEIPAHTHGKETLTGKVSPWTDTGLIGNTVIPSGIISKGTSFNNGVAATTAYGKSYQMVITATHEHNSVGGSGSHSHGDTGSADTFPYYYTVYIWERTA